MKQAILLLFTMIACLCGQAQNWKTVPNWEPIFFKAGAHPSYKGNLGLGRYYPRSTPPGLDSSILRVIYTISESSNGSDSVFHFYTSLRDTADEAGNRKSCVDTLAESWLGRRFIRKADGTELYFNSFGDTITIPTMAGLNYSWLLGKDTAGNWYKGTIATVGTINIDGVQDSVKTISIQAYKGTIPTTSPYNFLRLQFSKTYGWVKALDFYRFPNQLRNTDKGGLVIDSIEHIRLPVSFNIATPNNVAWRYTPGNEWIWVSEYGFYYHSTTGKAGYTLVRHDSVISFQQQAPGVGYATLRTTTFYRSNTYHFGTFKDSISITTNTHTDTVVDFNQPFITKFVENGWRNSIRTRHYIWAYDSSRHFVTTGPLYKWYPVNENGCIALTHHLSLPDDHVSFETYLTDFGLTHTFASITGDDARYNRYTYIKTGSTTFGTKTDITKLSVEKQIQKPLFSIYPNPANSEITVRAEGRNQLLKATFRNITGQVLYQTDFFGQVLTIPTDNFIHGVYFLELVGKESRETKKVLIQH